MAIREGHFYFIRDAFFVKVGDPFLKQNYERTSRPHFLAVTEEGTALLWFVPISSKVEKYKAILERRKAGKKPTDTIRIVKFQGMERALLFQDMFPTIEAYIEKPYLRNGQPVFITGKAALRSLTENAKAIIKLLRLGVRFTPTQPDIRRSENCMLAEIEPAGQEK
jgi:hypothetical protein